MDAGGDGGRDHRVAGVADERCAGIADESHGFAGLATREQRRDARRFVVIVQCNKWLFEPEMR